MCVRVGGFRCGGYLDAEHHLLPLPGTNDQVLLLLPTRTATNTARQHGATRTTLDCWLQLLIGQAFRMTQFPAEPALGR